MFDFLRKKKPAAEVSKAPVPAHKDPNAVHPLVAANRAKPRVIGVGIVYGRDGRPKIAPDFVAALSPVHRTWVDNDLAAHGFKLNAKNEVEALQ